ncbi:nitronate monooxygenase [Enteractinococcus fodinae]|uniref:Propionate 3-nitronate monooxygenase n=1 Tax=Enteractinococcus fodinae TaxID=684663 RepID=A0ABU2AWZ1_9MICC|nr:nitronate monooxygenase [Enteractinococcus fodinae]MDR7345868.1 nitronate monooxygenase [Enteractinococcus fodinae]
MEFRHPIVAAPMAGGPSSTALARAVASTGALGFLGGGNKTAQQLTEDYRAVADAGSVGVNLFVPDVANTAVDPVRSQEQRSERLAAFREKLLPFADRLGVDIPTVEQAGADVSDDWNAKLAAADEWPIVSFTFGLPHPEIFAQLHDSGTQVGVTVTTVTEARNAVEHGADFLVVQGPEAGGHRSVHDPLAEPENVPLLDLLDAVAEVVDIPLVAAGGIVTPEHVQEVLAHGAAAAAVGTALLLSDEAGTNPIHRKMLQEDRSGATQTTRVYSGRVSRSLVNEFMTLEAPAIYPEVNTLTVPIKRAAIAAMDPRSTHLFAGTGYVQARTGPAAEIVEWLASNRP